MNLKKENYVVYKFTLDSSLIIFMRLNFDILYYIILAIKSFLKRGIPAYLIKAMSNAVNK